MRGETSLAFLLRKKWRKEKMFRKEMELALRESTRSWRDREGIHEKEFGIQNSFKSPQCKEQRDLIPGVKEDVLGEISGEVLCDAWSCHMDHHNDRHRCLSL